MNLLTKCGITLMVLFLVIGCSAQVEKTAPEPQQSPDDSIDEIFTDIDDFDSLDEGLDDPELASLEEDLDNLDW